LIQQASSSGTTKECLAEKMKQAETTSFKMTGSAIIHHWTSRNKHGCCITCAWSVI
jgi:hypothetical protein